MNKKFGLENSQVALANAILMNELNGSEVEISGNN